MICEIKKTWNFPSLLFFLLLDFLALRYAFPGPFARPLAHIVRCAGYIRDCYAYTSLQLRAPFVAVDVNLRAVRKGGGASAFHFAKLAKRFRPVCRFGLSLLSLPFFRKKVVRARRGSG